MNWARRLGRYSAAAEDAILVLLLALMIGLAGSQIFLRNLFDSGISWADPLLRVLVLWLGLLGAMAATRDGNHIRIDLISRFLKPRHRQISQVIASLFTALVCGVVAWHAAQFVWMEYQDGMIVFAAVPAWLAEAIIPVGFGIMAIRNLLDAITTAFKGIDADAEANAP